MVGGGGGGDGLSGLANLLSKPDVMAAVNILGQLSSIGGRSSGWHGRNASYMVVGLPLASFFPEFLVPSILNPCPLC